jgi:hypothetical protein
MNCYIYLFMADPTATIAIVAHTFKQAVGFLPLWVKSWDESVVKTRPSLMLTTPGILYVIHPDDDTIYTD